MMASTPNPIEQAGVVVIGRNEGDRLKACLATVAEAGCPLVYVDSGSTDGSEEAARRAGAIVAALDSDRPFTAARARNVGWRRLLAEYPDVRYLHFFDGDCIPAAEWLPMALDCLEERPDVAAVCGWRREAHPDSSPYNLLCDIEWHGPTGEIDEFGGGALIRREALVSAGGYNDAVIAAEDTEFSVRLRKANWKLIRLPEDMEQHDARMTRWSQWWKRAVRSGHGHAEMHARHGELPWRCRSRETRSCLVWGLGIPFTALVLAWPTAGWSLLLFLAYGLLYVRIFLASSRALPLRHAHVFAASTVFAKFPEVLGLLRFHFNRLSGRQTQIIEYKPVPGSPFQA